MALRIRLSRVGTKKRPHYRIVVSDSRSPRDGRFLEHIGNYRPMLPRDHADRVKIDTERAKYWLEKGALPSDRVGRFLGAANLIAMPARRNNPDKAKPKAKAQERRAKAQAAGAGEATATAGAT